MKSRVSGVYLSPGIQDNGQVAFPRGALAGLVVLALVLAVGPVPAQAGGAGIYRYTDDRGVVHFTNVRRDEGYQVVKPPSGFRAGRIGRPARVRSYDRLISRAADEVGIPPALVKAVIAAESGFNPKAVSPKGAMGLMQLMPETAKTLGVADAFHEEANVRGGTRYLRRLHDRYGSWTNTLAAYNAGPGAVDRYRGVPPYAETRQYVRRVLSYYRRYHGDFPR